MLGTRYEEYGLACAELPFMLYTDLERTPFKRSSENNWHEELELQWCASGCGAVLLNGESHPIEMGDILVVNSNVIHYTGSDGQLIYNCLIVKTAFCTQMGIDVHALTFLPRIHSSALYDLLNELKDVYADPNLPCRIARLNELLLRILIELVTGYATCAHVPITKSRSFENIKHVIRYIREHYAERLSLDLLAGEVYLDKHTLCRDFKKLTGTTVISYVNRYRCQRAADFLAEGYTVAETAETCGFDTPSFFTRTFKRYMGSLPSRHKR